MDKMSVRRFPSGVWGIVVYSSLSGWWNRRFATAAELLAYLGL
jgi:hypothetical protein